MLATRLTACVICFFAVSGLQLTSAQDAKESPTSSRTKDWNRLEDRTVRSASAVPPILNL